MLVRMQVAKQEKYMDKIRLKNFLPIVLVVVLVGGIYGSASAIVGSKSTSAQAIRPSAPAAPQAVARPAQAGGGGCTGLRCTGLDVGGYGNHTSNTGGSGNTAGYSAVRFDVFRPIPGFESCTPENSDRNLFRDLGIPNDYSGPAYLHRRVAQERSGEQRVVAGVEDALINLAGNLWYNADSGAVDSLPGLARDKAPTQSNPWIGPDYLGRESCLPLNGGIDLREVLSNAVPVIRLETKNGVFSDPGNSRANPAKALIRLQNISLDVEVNQSSISGAISIYFELKDVVILVCDVDINEQFNQENGLEESLAGCFLSDNPDAPISFNTNNITFTKNTTGDLLSTKLDVNFKRQGRFVFALLGSYDATVAIAGGPITEAVGLSGASNRIFVDVISAKSINRR